MPFLTGTQGLAYLRTDDGTGRALNQIKRSTDQIAPGGQRRPVAVYPVAAKMNMVGKLREAGVGGRSTTSVDYAVVTGIVGTHARGAVLEEPMIRAKLWFRVSGLWGAVIRTVTDNTTKSQCDAVRAGTLILIHVLHIVVIRCVRHLAVEERERARRDRRDGSS